MNTEFKKVNLRKEKNLTTGQKIAVLCSRGTASYAFKAQIAQSKGADMEFFHSLKQK